MNRYSKLALLAMIIFASPGLAAGRDTLDTPYAINTQKEGEHPPTAQEAAALISLPPGFDLSLFAGDPNVHQPIAFEIDDRGRLWVAECYTYEGGNYDLDKRDRILIFEDTDGDGAFDQRKIFWDKAQRLTGLTLGFGGVWITSAPNLLFIADEDGDDIPDGKPEIKLEGFSILSRHNMVNGLRWGPDGWLYGRHGITDSSKVGTTSTPLGNRIDINCSIWRYHPTSDVFEVVTNGTTNPWGLDYDDHGQWFFTNNVVNHMWHVVPGAHYERMFGADFNKHVYGLIGPTADHYHWDTAGATGDPQNPNRKQYDGRHDDSGGGHSHAGGMIYLGDNWPAEYRGSLLMGNTHGRRVNRDHPVRVGNSYEGRHKADFLLANNQWFRGVDLKYGPDGGVYVTDWSDLGECHDKDGVHRTSGRIYKITYGMVKQAPVDLKSLSAAKLVELQLHANDWYVRRARRLLQERAARGIDMSNTSRQLLAMYSSQDDATRRLRAMWALYSIGAANETWLALQLDDPSEHVRTWAVKLLVDQTPQASSSLMSPTLAKLSQMARSDSSGLVRVFLASALQRLPIKDRWQIATNLLAHSEDASDRVQPLMLWYGIEAAVPTNRTRALELAKASQIPLVRRYIARRLTEEIEESPQVVARLLDQAAGSDRVHAVDYLAGMVEALRGRYRVAAPRNWGSVSVKFSGDEEVEALRRELAVVFGDGRAVDELLEVVLDGRADPVARHNALRVVIQSQPKDLVKTLLKLKNDRVIGGDAIRGLANYDDPQVPKQLLAAYPNAKHEQRPATIDALASRPNYAAALLDAVEAGIVDHRDISAAAAGKIAGHGDEALTQQLEKLWGAVRTTPAEKRLLIEAYRYKLTPDRLAQADLAEGRALFNQSCGACHKMFGQGGAIGPDLTGSNRDNLDYLLENVIDPSAVVPVELRLSVVTLKGGRVIAGSITQQDDRTLTLQTITDVQIVAKQLVDSIQTINQSLMPEGLLTPLTDGQVRDLMGYLKSTQQVSLRSQ